MFCPLAVESIDNSPLTGIVDNTWLLRLCSCLIGNVNCRVARARAVILTRQLTMEIHNCDNDSMISIGKPQYC